MLVNHLNSLNSIISLVVGLVSLTGGFLLWYRGAVEKRYAAERAFSHIRADLSAISTHLNQHAEEVDEGMLNLRLELKELKSLSLAQSQRFEAILARLELNTSGWQRSE